MKKNKTEHHSLPINIALVLATSVAVYWNSFFAFFMKDDFRLLNDARQIHHLSESFTSWDDSFFRPIIGIVFYFCYQLFDLAPVYYRLFNLAFHAINTMLVINIAQNFGLKKWGALTAGLIFCAHFVHWESIVWISGNSDILLTTFYLCTFISFSKYRQTHQMPFYFLAIFGTLLGLMTKESFVTIPGILLLYDFLRHPSPITSKVKLHAPFIIIVGIYVCWGLLHQASRVDMLSSNFSFLGLHPITKMITYLFWLVIPFYSAGAPPFFDSTESIWYIVWIIKWVFAFCLIPFLYWVVAKSNSSIQFLTGWTILSLIPFLFFTWSNDSRYTYLPSAPYSVLFGYLIVRLYQSYHHIRLARSFIISGTVAIIALFALSTNTSPTPRAWIQDGEKSKNILQTFQNTFPQIKEDTTLYLANFPEIGWGNQELRYRTMLALYYDTTVNVVLLEDESQFPEPKQQNHLYIKYLNGKLITHQR